MDHNLKKGPNRSFKQTLKNLTPAPIWAALRSAREYVEQIPKRRAQRTQVQQWRKQLEAAQLRKTPAPTDRLLQVQTLENRLANSGGLPLDVGEHDPVRVFKKNLSAQRRWSGVKGFEGLALDDALGWIEEYRVFSYVPLGSAVAEIFSEYSGRKDFSVLELGCGAGGLRVMLETFGAASYLGVDANPIPFFHSPFMKQAPRNYRLLNLQETIDFGVVFDVVCSFEVLEHIREERLDEIMRTLTNHMGASSLFIGTASITEEYDVHITVKERNWWLDCFARNGLIPPPAKQEASWLDLLGRSHPFNWRPTNTSMFVLRKD